MLFAVRFVIVSKDATFCKVVKDGLAAFHNVEMIVNVTSQKEAENKIARKTSTILLLDLDTVTVDLFLSQRMVSRFNNILTVLTARRESSAKHLIQPGTRDFALKPIAYNSANINKYLKLILSRMGGVVSSYTTGIDYKNITRTVGINDKIVAIASSTGGVDALETILSKLSANVPPIVLVQHMPSGFTKFFAERLNGKYPLDIKEAQTGDYLLQGQMLIAPAGNHMHLVQRNGKLLVECYLGQKIHGVIPSADVLFESIANILKKNAVGVILTGMGSDGARGLMLMHNNGAKTIGQNKETCVVYGMPKVAKDLGAVDYELPIDQIADKIMTLV
ncbi:MAG: CheB methylesterase domain-containing protein [Defluviitaleaceae bacterium]|nr:CheB methylesterase domain-containing protein [Defluviitaleaceae bacterium]